MNVFIILGAVLIGLSLGLLGSGGSIITVPLLIYVADEPAKLAIAESLFIVGCISAFGSISYIKRGLVSWKFILLFGLPSMFGTYFGAWTSQFVSGEFQLLTFSIVMLIASRSMFTPVTSTSSEVAASRNLFVISAGILVGGIAGFVGVGGGFFDCTCFVFTWEISLSTSYWQQFSHHYDAILYRLSQIPKCASTICFDDELENRFGDRVYGDFRLNVRRAHCR